MSKHAATPAALRFDVATLRLSFDAAAADVLTKRRAVSAAEAALEQARYELRRANGSLAQRRREVEAAERLEESNRLLQGAWSDLGHGAVSLEPGGDR